MAKGKGTALQPSLLHPCSVFSKSDTVQVRDYLAV